MIPPHITGHRVCSFITFCIFHLLNQGVFLVLVFFFLLRWWRWTCSAMTDGREAVSGPPGRDNQPLPFVRNSQISLPCRQMMKRVDRRGQERKRGYRNTGEVTMARNLRLSCDAALIPVPSGRRLGKQDFNHSCCQTGAPEWGPADCLNKFAKQQCNLLQQRPGRIQGRPIGGIWGRKPHGKVSLWINESDF